MSTTFKLEISDREFDRLRDFFLKASGIRLPDNRKALVAGRLNRRLRARELATYDQYAELLESGADPAENELATDLLTTNETYFFREPEHFEWLRRWARDRAGHAGGPLRVWSAASSSGEEPFTLALTLADTLGMDQWSITASDLSMTVLEAAADARYALERADRIPGPMLKRWGLRGRGDADGTFTFTPELRAKVAFFQVNLIEPLPDWQAFDLIFLRNVLIYFEPATKVRIVDALLKKLKPDGRLVVGHAESLTGLCPQLVTECPGVYRRRQS